MLPKLGKILYIKNCKHLISKIHKGFGRCSNKNILVKNINGANEFFIA